MKNSDAFEKSRKEEPFRRALARFLDYSLWLTFCKFFTFLFFFEEEPSLFPFDYFLWVFVEALLLSTWGKTPGKRFLKIGIQQGKMERLSYYSSIRRAFRVWIVGVGMMSFVLLPFFLFSSYRKLKKEKRTNWDYEEGIQLFYFPIGISRKVIASSYIFLSFYFFSDLFSSIVFEKNILQAIFFQEL